MLAPLQGIVIGMNKTKLTFAEAVAAYDRARDQAHIEQGAQERQQMLNLFPLEAWPAMTLDRYALGLPNVDTLYCVWAEFRSPHLGSIRGGSAKKMLIFKRKNKEGWFFDPAYESVEKAWDAVRAGFVRAFELAHTGDFAAIDQIKEIAFGPALVVKSLHLYFPDRVLPVCSREHIIHFLKAVGNYSHELENENRVALNQALTKALLGRPEFIGWTTNEIERFLYWWTDPRETQRVVKIAPGENAKYWDDCLNHGYIRVGWDEIGDLRAFATKDEFYEEFDNRFGTQYDNHRPTIKRKANELWKLAELEEGDIVVANQGISKILALGEVIAPGYEWKPDLSEFRHTVPVKWDTSYAQEVEPQKKWAFLTAGDVPAELYATILKGGKNPPPIQPVAVDSMFTVIGDALERRSQVILYGPPGTGKTFVARRFAVWWLLRESGEDGAALLANRSAFEEAERQLTSIVTGRRVWWVVANAKEWEWVTLFSKGSQIFSRRKLRRHYDAMRPGDLVIGYQAAPEKRILALAQVTRVQSQLAGDNDGFELKPLVKVVNGPSYSDVLERDLLKKSEPMRFNNQGTLFALTEDEVEELADLIGENDPESARQLTNGQAGGTLTWTTFHPSYAYEDFVEGLRPFDAGEGKVGLRLEDGVFKRICRAAETQPHRKHLLVIDEINRANVSKVFGELITLLEKDKRGLSLVLPQSKQQLAVPKNLYIVATMNTADRSIKLIDAALRRRFAFVELMPDSQKLQGASIGALALDELMDELNDRITKHVGREKQLGHSYFLEGGQPITDPDQFARRFRQEILPVLQEFCYDDYASLAQYLGDAIVDREAQRLNEEVIGDASGLIGALAALVANGKTK